MTRRLVAILAVLSLAASAAGEGYTVVRTNAPWTPIAVDGLALWFDASDASTMWADTNATTAATSGARVARWDDKSGNARHLVQATEGLRPTRAGSGLAYTNNWLKTTNYTLGNSAFTAYTAMDSDQGSGTFGSVWLSGGATISEQLVMNAVSGYLNCTFRSPSGANIGATVSNLLDPKILGIGYNGGGTAHANHFVRDDGWVRTAAGSGAIGYLAETGFSVGKRPVQNTAQYVGNLSELVFWSTNIAVADREGAEGYLAHKWGLTNNLPATHPYKVSAIVPTMVTTAIARIEWDEVGTATNYHLMLGETTTNFLAIASTASTSHDTQSSALNEASAGKGNWYWRIEAQTEEGVVTGAVARFVSTYVGDSSPAYNQTVTDSTVTLAWNPARVANVTNYAVYFGAVATNLALIANTGTTRTHGPIDLLTESTFGTMFWRVDAQTADATIEGPVAQFVDGYVVAAGTTKYVDQSSPTPRANYGSPATAAHTIEAALAVAQGGDTVLVAPGTYEMGNPSLMGTNRVILPPNVHLVSMDGPRDTRINGFIGFTNNTTQTVAGFRFEGLTVGGDLYTDAASGIFRTTFSSSLPTISNCWFLGNTKLAGQPLAVMAYTVVGRMPATIADCLFAYNVHAGSSGCEIFGGSVYNSLFVGSQNLQSGAVGGGTLVSNCTIVGASHAINPPWHQTLTVTNSTVHYSTFTATHTNPLFRASARYTNATWTAANTGTNFPAPPYDAWIAFAPMGGSDLRKEGLGAVPYKPIPTPRVAHRIRTGGN